jgi:8-oxo-dGTP diphosphatase
MVKKGKVAAAMFVNNEGKILLQLRDNKPEIQNPDTWGFVGGHVEPNETVLEGLEREVLEEIGFNIKNPIFIKCFDDCVGNDVFLYRGCMDVKAEDLKLAEGREVRFFSFDEIMNLDKVPQVMIKLLRDFKEKIFE